MDKLLTKWINYKKSATIRLPLLLGLFLIKRNILILKKDLIPNPINHLISNNLKNRGHIEILLGRRLHKLHIILLGKLFALLHGNLPLLGQIGLGPHQNHIRLGAPRLSDLIDPVLNVVVTGGVRY